MTLPARDPRRDLDPPSARVPGLRFIETPLERLYLAALGRDRRRQLSRPPHRLGIPVISVGNISVGGTGKTPVVEAFARAWLRRGGRPGILSRGYRAARGADRGEGNDEFRLLARRLPGVPHVAERDRSAGGERLRTEHPDVDLVILDDGFQHRRLHRDLDVVLIDATRPFGGGRCLPAGWLREPVRALDRADAIVITRGDQVSTGALRELRSFLDERFPHATCDVAQRVVEGVRGPDGAGAEFAGRAAEPVGAFCAIGNPEAFFATLPELGVEVVWTRTFRDHHAYSCEDLVAVRRAARAAGARRLLTTEKDGVKLESLPGFASEEPPVEQVRIRVEFPVEALLDQVSGGTRAGGSTHR